MVNLDTQQDSQQQSVSRDTIEYWRNKQNEAIQARKRELAEQQNFDRVVSAVLAQPETVDLCD